LNLQAYQRTVVDTFIGDANVYSQAETLILSLPGPISAIGPQRLKFQAKTKQATREMFEQLHHKTSVTARDTLFLDAPSIPPFPAPISIWAGSCGTAYPLA
jgi:hypothetical protein